MITLLGISAFYGEKRGGHYDTVPKALLDSAAKSREQKVVYAGPAMGSHEGPSEDTCSSLKRLQNPLQIFFTEKDDKNVVDFISSRIRHSGAQAVFIYEGHVLWIPVVQKLAQLFPSVRFLVNMHHADFMLVGSESFLSRKLIYRTLARTKKFNNVGVTFESEFLHARFKSQKFVGLGTFPIVSIVPEQNFLQKRRTGSLISLSGITRQNLGPVLGLLAHLKDSGRDILLFRPPNLIKERLGPEMKLITESLSTEQYSKLLGSVKEVWFLPLQKMNYFGSSGRLADAIAAEAIPIVPDGSALQEFCSKHASHYAVYGIQTNGAELIVKDLRGEGLPTGPREALTQIERLCLGIHAGIEGGAVTKSTGTWICVLINALIRVRIRFLKTFSRDATTLSLA